MVFYIISKSTLKHKKYDVFELPHKLVTRFGDSDYSDYTLHKDEERKNNYIKRHIVNEDWKDLTKAGTWARYILWNKDTIQKSIKNMEDLFKIKIILS
jgi:hypothetical protein